jgi:cytochrome c-type biogenesis protein CcmH
MIELSPDSLVFWLVAAAMIVVALLSVLPRLWRGPRGIAAVSRTALNAAIYRREIAELEGDHDTGQTTAAQRAAARAELERRLLADTQDDAPRGASGAGARRTAVVVSLVLPAAAIALYLLFGEPSAIRGEADRGAFDSAVDLANPGIRDELVGHLERNPRDGRGWVLLGRADAAADRFADSAQAFERALAASPKVAADAGVWCEYADALGMAQGGQLAGKPRELVMRALSISPAHPKALEMAGSAAYEAREFDAAARYWRQLANQLPEGSSSHRELGAAIARADRLALLTRPMSPDTPH